MCITALTNKNLIHSVQFFHHYRNWKNLLFSRQESQGESAELLEKLAITKTYSMHEAEQTAKRLMELVPALDKKVHADLRSKVKLNAI